MSYPIKAHTLPLLEKILGTAGLADQVKAFIAELDKWNAEHPDGKNDGTKHENLHEYLVFVRANHPLYNRIYDILGTSRCAPYALGQIKESDIQAYVNACKTTGKWTETDYQPGSSYLMCHSATLADERIILNFKEQAAAFAFVNELKDKADKSVSFKILLGSHLEAVNKNDKIVIYYPKAQRSALLALVDAIPDAQLAPQISGFYLKVKDGIGIAAETKPTWSYTMYTAEYCMKYLVSQTRDNNQQYNIEEMYNYAMRRLEKNGRFPAALADPADLAAAKTE